MPQLQDLVLTDRTTPTAVNHTFTPREVAGNVGHVAEGADTPLGENRVSISMVKTTGGRYKGQLKFSFPVVQTQVINGVSSPVVTRTAYAELNVNFANTSTEAERNNAIGMIASALAPSKVLVNDALVKLQGVY